ncbi:hypothetical protein [Sphingomonas aerophila]|uniref:Uncharacterized protein n=1 Tax=Sphingomonas aerophila TaxID=1344948 RepID=A0A7W9BFW1_9SPHN|nr:hypothetical protein [Sphingomonas aerophila]MBB5716433.1 hypothetical protein [Sphingomonas aerophila]
MTIKECALFETTKALWPDEVRVSGKSNATNEIYQRHENAFPQDDDWQQLALWSFHQALGTHEKQALAKGLPSIYPREVTFAEFDTWMRSNLKGDHCWSAERAEYEESEPRHCA